MEEKIKKKPNKLVLSLLVLVIMLVGFFVYQEGFSYGVSINDEVLAHLKKEAFVEEAFKKVEEIILDNFGDTAYFKDKLEYSRVRTEENDLDEVDDLVKIILRKIDVYKAAKTVYLDDEAVLSINKDVQIDDIINSIEKDILKRIKIEVLSDEIKFTQKLEVKDEDVNVKEIYPEEMLRFILDPIYEDQEKEIYDIITLSTVNESGFSTRTLSKEDIETIERKPLELVAYGQVKETKALYHKNITEKTSDLYKGESKLKQTGRDGKKEIIKKLKFVNGLEVDYEIIGEKVLEEAVNHITLVGTKERPKYTPSTSGGLSGKKIMLDPGHGGYDPGATQNGVREVDLNDKLTAAIAEKLQNNGATVLYTRKLGANTYLSLEDRANIANRSNIDLFLSVHHDSGSKSSSGISSHWSSYRPGLDTSNAYVKYEGKEYKFIDEVKGKDDPKSSIEFLLNEEKEEVLKKSIMDVSVYDDRSLSSVAANSSRIANILRTQMLKIGTYTGYSYTKDRNLYVTRWTNMPSVLIEAGFISNPKELERINTDEHRDHLSGLIVEGIISYFK